MKNVTLSMPEDWLEQAREFARKQGATLNQMIRDLLKDAVQSDRSAMVQDIEALYGKIKIDSSKMSHDRDELHER